MVALREGGRVLRTAITVPARLYVTGRKVRAGRRRPLGGLAVLRAAADLIGDLLPCLTQSEGEVDIPKDRRGEAVLVLRPLTDQRLSVRVDLLDVPQRVH